MARELGLNPHKFGKLANEKQEPWKKPLPEFIELQQRLEALLGSKVDLGTPRSLRPRIKERVLQEAIRVA